VEVDETFIGGVKPGKRGRGVAGKALVVIAVEQLAPKGFGWARMAVIPDATAPTLRAFLPDNVEQGSVVLSDGLKSYPFAVGSEFTHKPFNVAGSGVPAHVPLPGVHRVASLAKRWLLGTHQGAVEADHLQAYLNEFCFRFNRLGSRSRGMLFFRLMQQAVDAPPVTYRQLVVNPQPGSRPDLEPPPTRHNPSSLALPPAGRPWRPKLTWYQEGEPELDGEPISVIHFFCSIPCPGWFPSIDGESSTHRTDKRTEPQPTGRGELR